MIDQVQDRLVAARIEGAVSGRPKHLYSIYEKMVVKGKEFDEIYDLVGVRVLVESVKDCWASLGAVHGAWTPIQGRFKDYINTPKFNLYQSLHTTVVGPQGKPLEFQIRTSEMHNRAERGIAAHWGYKERASASDVAWLQRIVDWQRETADPAEFLETLKLDLEQDEVFVFTPKGDVVTLPVGATPVDFAYSIHTEVGHRCIGARVNGRLVPLDSKLSSGDTRRDLHVQGAVRRARRDWLKIVVIPPGPQQDPPVVQPRTAGGRHRNRARGARQGAPPRGPAGPEADRSPCWPSSAQSMNYTDLDALHAAIGEGHVSARSVAQRLARDSVAATTRSRSPPPRRQARAGRAARPPTASTSRASTTSWSACPGAARRCPATRSSALSPGAAGSACTAADCANAAALAAGEGAADRSRVGPGPHRVFVAAIEVRPSTGPGCWRRRVEGALRAPLQHPAQREPHRRPTGSAGCASSSSWPTRPISNPCSRRSSASTASTTPTASCPARAEGLSGPQGSPGRYLTPWPVPGPDRHLRRAGARVGAVGGLVAAFGGWSSRRATAWSSRRCSRTRRLPAASGSRPTSSARRCTSSRTRAGGASPSVRRGRPRSSGPTSSTARPRR